MKKKTSIAAPLALLCLVSCDRSYDLGTLNKEIQVFSGLTIPVVEKDKIVSSSDLFGSEISQLDISSPDNFNVTIPEADYGKVISVPSEIAFSTAGREMPHFLKDAKSSLLFDNSAVIEVSVSNPLPCSVLFEGDVTDGTRKVGTFSHEIQATGSPDVKSTVPIRLNTLDIQNVPERLILKNIHLKTLGTAVKSAFADNSIRSAAGTETLSFSGNLSIPFRFLAGSKLEFNYEFTDFNIDLSQLKDYNTTRFALRGKISTNLPLKLDAYSEGELNATMTTITGPCTDAAFTLEAETPGGISSVNKCTLHFKAEAKGIIDLGDFVINIKVSGVYLPQGIILNGE